MVAPGHVHQRKHWHRNLPHAFEGRGSRIYDVVARRLVRGMYRRLADDVALIAPQGGAVLDIGTGPGVLLVEIARRRPDLRLTGIDLSADMVGKAARNALPYAGQISVKVADATDLPFADDSFDLVVTSLSLHHWDHPEAAAPQLARVLRPGGRLCVYDFPFAPFDLLAGAFGGPAQKSVIRTGAVFPRHCVRYLMSP
jgi:ubiquinone/menaquinone biosynthesis C-methylase UbiE